VRPSSRRLGVTRGQVVIADSDPDWPSAYAEIAAGLQAALAGLGARIEHVGSTSVPGLAAKPIIDVAVAVEDDTIIGRVIRAVQLAGWIYRGDQGAEGGHVFALDDRPDHRIAHLHVVLAGDPQWTRYLAFRDRLRQDPAARAAYEALKRQLAVQFPGDRKGYTEAKESFIRSLNSPPPAVPPGNP
jgi:GrpB-like predicted nucleotidyltransferase (UPF0157 family)